MRLSILFRISSILVLGGFTVSLYYGEHMSHDSRSTPIWVGVHQQIVGTDGVSFCTVIILALAEAMSNAILEGFIILIYFDS